MKLRFFTSTLLFGLAIACVALANWPPQSLRGMVRDASTGKPIPSVYIFAYADGTGGQRESKSDPTGAYRVGVQATGACVVYQAVGYRVRALRWPEDLSPSDNDKQLGFEIREVALEPMPVAKQ